MQPNLKFIFIILYVHFNIFDMFYSIISGFGFAAAGKAYSANTRYEYPPTKAINVSTTIKL